jgi:gamma-glutamylcyclotransferase (GGCT)/AIG2-like uncharacterized protein YtfP
MSALLSRIMNIVEPQKFDINRYGRKHTPDMLKLQQHKRHLVFLPCNVQKGFKYHHFVKQSEPYGLGYTRRKFQVYTKDLGNESFPIPLPGIADKKYLSKRLNPNLTPPSLNVRGQLYWCDANTISELDNFKLNGVEFTRELVEIKFLYQEPITQLDRDTNEFIATYTDYQVYILAAYMYVGNEEYWDEQLDAGYLFTPCKAFKANKNKATDFFYEFR